MGGGNPITSFISDLSNAGNRLLDDTVGGVRRDVEKGLDDVGRAITDGGNKLWEEGAKVVDKAGRELGRGLGELTGKNAYERTMKDTADRQEAESNRLMWERKNKEAQFKESDAQAEARKRMRALQQGGRAGTILTGFEPGTSTSLGSGIGKDLLGG